MDWNKIDEELYNPYLSYEQNVQNGVNLPKEGQPVLIYDSDKPRYLVGRIGVDIHNKDRLVVYESVHGDIYSGVKYIFWKEFDFCNLMCKYGEEM